MRKATSFIVLAFLLVLCAAPVYANGIPALPHAFYGNVTINGSPAPAGTTIEARGEGVLTGIEGNPITTSELGKYGSTASPELDLIVQGNIASGAEISFLVNGIYTGQTYTFQSGETTALDLALVVTSESITGKVEKTIPPGQTNYVVDASAEAQTTVTVNTTAEATITVKKYHSNPHPEVELPATMLPRYIDIEVDNHDAITWPMYVEQTYTDAEVAGLVESSLGMYYFKGGGWHRCSDTGVNTLANYIWANMTRDELSGSPVAIGGTVAPAPVGGAAGAPPAITTLGLTGLVAMPSLQVDRQGIVQETCQLKSADGKLTLDIAKGVKLLDSVGNPLASLSAAAEPSPPAPPPGEAIIAAYNLGPNGATFSPGISLTIEYDPKRLPEGADKKDLYIAYWDGSNWIALKTTVNTETNTVSCYVTHFTTFAVIARPAPPAPAAFSVSNLRIQPAEVHPKEAVTIAVSVANTGGMEGSYSVVLKINGAKEAERSVTVAPGKSQDVSFSVTREEAASYTVAVDGLSGKFTVVAPPAPPAPPPPAPPVKPPINWPVIGGIIAAVVVVGLLIFFLARRRAA